MSNFNLSLDLPKYSSSPLNSINAMQGNSEHISSIAKTLDKIGPKSIAEQVVNIGKDFQKLKSNFETQEQEKNQAIIDYEDELRKHTEDREDTKYQRAVADMRKAGINPNLYTNINVGQYSSDLSNTIENMLQKELQGEQLSNETFNKIVGVVGNIFSALVFKGKIKFI